jgi:ferredoxin-NADP reductase
VTLVYGNQRTDTIMFRYTLDALKDRYLDRFTLIHVLSREPQDVALLNGRITGEKVIALSRAGAIDLKVADGVFLCGPGAMIDDVAAALGGAGVPKTRVHFERFYQDGEAPRASASPAMATIGVMPDPAAIRTMSISPLQTKRPSGGITWILSPALRPCAKVENAPSSTRLTPTVSGWPGRLAME